MLHEIETREKCTIVLHTTTAHDALLRRVRSEFKEMPGMRLTEDQAMRLWSLDRATCHDVLSSLVDADFLAVDAIGRYRRAHPGY